MEITFHSQLPLDWLLLEASFLVQTSKAGLGNGRNGPFFVGDAFPNAVLCPA